MQVCFDPSITDAKNFKKRSEEWNLASPSISTQPICERPSSESSPNGVKTAQNIEAVRNEDIYWSYDLKVQQAFVTRENSMSSSSVTESPAI
jgi:hypothetical protein